MNLVLIFLAALAVLALGYVFYGRYLEKKWGIDPARETPSQDCFDGKDYVPTPPTLVFGHHFASIASGLGMVCGAYVAWRYGWLPALLWLLVGGIFFGAAQDFGAIFASLRMKGRSIGYLLRERVGEKAQRLFSVLALIVLVLLVAVFVNLLSDIFGFDVEPGTALISVGKEEASATASAATASLLSVPVALLFGFLAFRKNLPMIPVAIISFLLLVGSVWASFYVGVNLPPFVWVGVLALYLMLASLTPVWAMLQPRDFLCACLAVGVMLLGAVALIGAALTGKAYMTLPAVATYEGVPLGYFGGLLIVPGGAIVGYHALVAAGTTSKQLANEKHARRVSMGAMLLSALLAVVAILAVSLDDSEYSLKASLDTIFAVSSKLEFMSSTVDLFAWELAFVWQKLFGGSGESASEFFFQLVLLAVTVFALTTLDTCVRLARYLFAELFNPEGRRLKKLEGAQRFFATPAVGTLIVVVLGCALALACQREDPMPYNLLLPGRNDTGSLWWVFGTANLLLAAMVLLSLSVWLKQEGKTAWMLRVPGLVCLLAALCGYIILGIVFAAKLYIGMAGISNYLLAALSLVLLVLAVLLLVQLLPRLWKKEQAQEAADDVD